MVLLPNQLTSEWLVGEELLPLLERGDLIEVKRPLQNNGLGYYMHWVVYLGMENGLHMGAHRSTETSDFGSTGKELLSKLMRKIKPTVRFDDLAKVLGGDLCRINNQLDARQRPFPPSIIVYRVKNQLGTGGYNILHNNCEHFAKWARYGLRESEQSINFNAVAVGVTSALLTASLTSGTTIGAAGYLLLKAAQHMKRAGFLPSIL